MIRFNFIFGLLATLSLFIISLSGSYSDPLPTSTLPTANAVIPLWSGLAPGEQKSGIGEATFSGGITRLTDVFTPQMLIYTPTNNNSRKRPAILIYPGGGYGVLAQDLEGTEIAAWLNSLGYVAAVVDYRVPDNKEGAFQDGQRSVSVLRSRAKEFGIDPNKIGVIGFSAGGDLAARVGSAYGTPTYTNLDKFDRSSNRPDFVLLIYPAYLIDKNDNISTDVTPHSGMPPFFLVQTKDDPFLDVPEYAKALEQAGVQANSIVYDRGGHGYGLRVKPTDDSHDWPNWAAIWLKATLNS